VTGVPPQAGSGCQPSASAADASSRSGIPNAGFTPAPWFVERGHDEDGAETETLHICHAGTVCENTTVCQVWNDAEANARLIAAAPELYEALEICLAMGERQLKSAMNLNGQTPYDIGLAAIRKARGAQ
jgi:hypothetical protein